MNSSLKNRTDLLKSTQLTAKTGSTNNTEENT